jgi:peptidoglycan hydrolase CwlO-like protein
MSGTEPPVTVAAPVAPSEPVVLEPPARSSKAWLGWLAGFAALALLAGATAVLFVRVQDAQQQADDAVAVAGGSQTQLQAQLDQINRTLTEIQQDGQATRDDVADLTSQLTALKKCVNTALDAIAQAGQTGKPVTVTKC